MIGFSGTSFSIALNYNHFYNSSQSVTASDSSRFLLEYERLPSHCGCIINWLLRLTNSHSISLSTISLLSSRKLWPTVSRSVCLRIKHPPGAYAHISVTVIQWQVCSCGALSRTGGRVCHLQLLLSLVSAFSGPSPVGLLTGFYCLRFETSLFVASYDWQGYGRGIRPRLHTGVSFLV
jgi:hypothetical protein